MTQPENQQQIMDAIQHHIEIVATKLERHQVANDWGLGALEWLENDLRQRREQLDDAEKTVAVEMIGSFLGECLRRAYHGRWVGRLDTWGVEVNKNGLTTFPFNKVQKFIENGDIDSFVSLFRMMPTVMQVSKVGLWDRFVYLLRRIFPYP